MSVSIGSADILSAVRGVLRELKLKIANSVMRMLRTNCQRTSGEDAG